MNTNQNSSLRPAALLSAACLALAPLHTSADLEPAEATMAPTKDGLNVTWEFNQLQFEED